jgi:hypothetical protein
MFNWIVKALTIQRKSPEREQRKVRLLLFFEVLLGLLLLVILFVLLRIFL